MSATPIVYASTDGSAPVLDGTNGSFIALLRAILVNGYGAKAAAGWTEPYTAAGNVAAFRSNSVVGTGHYHLFNDNGSTAGVAKTATWRGYVTMSALGVGTGEFPTAVQETAGLHVRKSETANSTARAWWAIACRKWIYIAIDSNSGGISVGAVYFFGDYLSHRPGDAFNSGGFAGGSADPATSADRSTALSAVSSISATPTATPKFYGSGAYTQIAASISLALNTHIQAVQTAVGGGGSIAYPHPSNNGLLFSDILILEAANVVRGQLPNVKCPWHNRVLADLTSLPNVPATGLTGLSKLFQSKVASAAGAGELIFDLTTSN